MHPKPDFSTPNSNKEKSPPWKVRDTPSPCCPIHYLTLENAFSPPPPLYYNYYTFRARVDVNLNFIMHLKPGWGTPKSEEKKVPTVGGEYPLTHPPPLLSPIPNHFKGVILLPLLHLFVFFFFFFFFFFSLSPSASIWTACSISGGFRGRAQQAPPPPPIIIIIWSTNLFFIPFCIRMLINKAQIARESIFVKPRASGAGPWTPAVYIYNLLRPPQAPPPNENAGSDPAHVMLLYVLKQIRALA